MDTEVLIALVSQKRPIWDKKNKLHSNRHVVDNCWKEISEEMKVEEMKLKKKWKYLRDQFAVEQGKIPVSHSGDSGDESTPSKWPYFESLRFLKDIVKPRASTGNLSQVANKAAPTSQPLDEFEAEGESQIAEDTVPSDNKENDDADPGPVQNEVESQTSRKRSCTVAEIKQKRTKMSTFNAALLDLEKQKLQYFKEKRGKNAMVTDDEDFHFFQSLLPHVRQIPASRKLTFRSRVQALVEEFVYDPQYPAPSPASYSGVPSPQSTCSSVLSHPPENAPVYPRLAAQQESHPSCGNPPVCQPLAALQESQSLYTFVSSYTPLEPTYAIPPSTSPL